MEITWLPNEDTWPPCWWCGATSAGRAWGQGDNQWMFLCPSCAGALKAVLPDAPDWRAEALSAAIKVLAESDYLVDMLEAGGFTDNARPYVNNILEAAQRLVEAAGHLDTPAERGK